LYLREVKIISIVLLSVVLGCVLYLELSNEHHVAVLHSQNLDVPVKITKADRIELAFEQEFLKTFDPTLKYVPRERLKAGQNHILARRNMRVEAKAVNLNWEERGPYNVGGRTKAIMWDPNDVGNTKVWAGAASGGLWFNDDITSSSSEWEAVDDLMENLSVTAIAYDPTNTNTMYIGTGEGHIIGSVRGAGMLKSTNGGSSWTHMIPGNGFHDTESDFHYVNDILVVDEGGNDVIYVATQESLNEYTYSGYAKSGERGLWRSTDGGVTFTQYLSGFSIGDLEIDSNGRIYAGTARDLTNAYNAQIFYSDNGTTWTLAHDFGGGDRVELAIAPSDPDVIYAVAANGGTVLGLVQATDAVATPTFWTSRTVPNHSDPNNGAGNCAALSCSTNGDFTRDSQAFYDLILKVDPTNSDRVWVGGIDLHVSTNGGSSWAAKTSWVDINGFGCSCLPYVHADQHVLEFNPADNTELLSGNDGGVFFSSNANATTPSWAMRNNRYNVTQFYGGAIHSTAGTNQFLAGAQDNGSQYFNGTGMITTTEASGGDGAYCNIDQDEPQYQWTQYVYNTYYRSTNSGVSFGSQINLGSSTGRFINPSVYDDVQDIMYAARNANQYLRWTNPQTGSTANSVSANFGGHQVSALTVSPNISHRVYFGTGNSSINGTGSGNIYYVDNANTGTSVTPVAITGSGFPANSYVSCIAVEDGDENHIVVTFSNYGVSSVWETEDGGSNWTAIEGNLPDMPVRWAIIHPEDPNRILLATELGVWSTDDTNAASTDWQPHSDENFPHVRTDMLKVRASDLEMIAITHGRGLWSTNITLPTTTFPEISFSNLTDNRTETTTSTIDCRKYRDHLVTMKIANPPTGDAIVTLTINGSSTASEGYDFDYTTTDFVTPSTQLTFPSGASLNRTFTVRVYDDDAVESSETIVFDYAISGTTDAIAGPSNQTHTLTINDEDSSPILSSYSLLFDEDFESITNMTDLTNNGWLLGSFDSGLPNGNVWRAGSQRVLSGSNSMYVSRSDVLSTYNVNSESNTVIVTPIIDATGLTDINLEFNYQCNGEFAVGTYWDYGSLYYVIDEEDDGVVTNNTFIQFQTNIQGITSTTFYQTTVPTAVNGQKFAIAFAWINDTNSGSQPAFVVDDIEVSSNVIGQNIATAQNQTHETNFGPFETIYYYDDVTGDILLALENLSTHDYGCTSVTITNAGTGAMAVNETTSTYYPGNKTFDVNPEFNNTNGAYNVTLYYTEAEINGWMAATGNLIGDLEIAKIAGTLDANFLANDTPWESDTAPIVSSLGSNYAIQASFATGFSSFGIANTEMWENPLPVELTSFTAKLENDEVKLAWQTTSERNSDYFQIEFSRDGTHFENIGRVQSGGESSELRDYSFIHRSPLLGLNFYRLKAIDFDGAFEYSKVKFVEHKVSDFRVSNVYPNPATDHVTVNYSSSVENTIVQVIGLDGKLIMEQKAQNTGQTTLQVGELKRGIYFIRVSDGFRSDVKKIILR
jgi:hypothetical protein